MSMDNRTEDRSETMRNDGLYVGIAGMSLLNGMHFSPYFDPIFILLRPFAPSFFITSPILMFYFTSLFISALTLVLGGVGAAIYERGQGLARSNATSLWIWLGGVMALTLPTIFAMAAR